MISNSLPLKLTANTIQIPPITEKNSPTSLEKRISYSLLLTWAIKLIVYSGKRIDQ